MDIGVSVARVTAFAVAGLPAAASRIPPRGAGGEPSARRCSRSLHPPPGPAGERNPAGVLSGDVWGLLPLLGEGPPLAVVARRLGFPWGRPLTR